MNNLVTLLSTQSMAKILVASLVVTALYWQVFYDDGSSLDAQLANVSQQLDAEEKKKTDTDNALKQVQEMTEKVGQLSLKYQEISRRLPSVLFSIDINKAIDEFARNAGLSVKTKKPGENVKKAVVEEVPVDVVLEGSYSELAQFTYLVSAAERMARVKNITITETDGGPKKLKFEGQVVGYKLATEEKKQTENKAETTK